MPFSADLHLEPHTTSPVYIWDSEGGYVRLFVSGAVLSQQLIERDAPEPMSKTLGFGRAAGRRPVNIENKSGSDGIGYALCAA